MLKDALDDKNKLTNETAKLKDDLSQERRRFEKQIREMEKEHHDQLDQLRQQNKNLSQQLSIERAQLELVDMLDWMRNKRAHLLGKKQYGPDLDSLNRQLSDQNRLHEEIVSFRSKIITNQLSSSNRS